MMFFAGLQFALPVEERGVSSWLRTAEAGAETGLGETLVVRKTSMLDGAVKAALRYAELKDRFLEVNPERQGGEPVIRGTPIPSRWFGPAHPSSRGDAHVLLLQRPLTFSQPAACSEGRGASLAFCATSKNFSRDEGTALPTLVHPPLERRPQLHPRRDGPGHQPRGQDPLQVRRA
jgi:hypothetical protein